MMGSCSKQFFIDTHSYLQMKSLYRINKSCTAFSLHYKSVSTISTAKFEQPILEEEDCVWICTRTTFLQIQQTLVQKCAKQRAIVLGKSCHAQITQFGLQSDTSTSNMLINMYSKCGVVDYARKVFDEMRVRSVVSWNTMIGAFTQNGNGVAALKLFIRMLREGSEFSEFALSSVLCACASNVLASESKQLHAFVVKSSMESNAFVATALLDVYAKCRSVEDALRVFEAMPEKSDVSWSSMMAGFVQNDLYEEALSLFLTAQRNDVEMNVYTISSVLSACAALAALIEGKQVHTVVYKTGFGANEYIASSLVDVYAKCGSIAQSYAVFSEAEKTNVILWNTMISGFARHARPLEAMMLFEKMQQAFLWPNEVTYVSILSACAHVGLAEKGRKYFDMMKKEHNLSPNVVHYSCMVDILGKTGQINEAKELIEKMPFEGTASIWGSLLASCRVYRNVELAEVAARKLFEIEPNNAGNHVLLSNIYAANGRWADVASARKLLKSSEAKKERGKSWIEIKDSVHSFMVGERNHPRIAEIYSRLDKLLEEMEKLGFKGHIEHDLHDVEDDHKRELLKHHSEKLAFTLGLMCLPSSVPIRIMKNLRICGDCHQFMKVASALTRHEIIVRDNNRFHHFREGYCSCGEFW
ncbi:Pentatricopeptide repeat superfamily protein [Perilla frutescens var. frutescens]|nr:Pentatricopeptide repeat superfamily protein [Perilla frutescens var. frutescens]